MPKKSETLLVSANIACNKICKAIKDKGLPHNSVWLYINHLVHNLDADPNLTDHQRQIITDLCHEYLEIVKNLHAPQTIRKQGLHLLSEIRAMQQARIHSHLQEEKEFAAELLMTVNKNLHRIYKDLRNHTSTKAVSYFKEQTLAAMQNAEDKASILAIVEDAFDRVGEAVKHNMTAIKDSFDCMLDLESKALIDPLCSIFNRRFYDQELPKIVHTFLAQKGLKPFSMLVLDIDNFKEINDRHGHFVGDYALQRVAEILQKNCRAGIDSPIRLGGDEFALFLIGADQKVAAHKAQKIRDQIAAKEILFSRRDDSGQDLDISFAITVSIGVSQLDYGWKDVAAQKLIGASLICNPDNSEPLYKLTCKIAESADEALYLAKEQGKNRICVYRKSAEIT